MKRWVFVVVALYGTTLALLTLLVMILLGAEIKLTDGTWTLGAGILLFMLLEAGLLATPASASKHRPVRRRAVVSTYVAAGLAASLLFVCVALSVAAVIWGDETSEEVGNAIFGVGVCLWVAWGILFHRLSKRQSAESTLIKQCRLLLQGSILDLLIAIPCHVIVRRRDTCCAEALTFLGIAAGTAVMLFTFGPSVYFLFASRRDRMRPKGSPRPSSAPYEPAAP